MKKNIFKYTLCVLLALAMFVMAPMSALAAPSNKNTTYKVTVGFEKDWDWAGDFTLKSNSDSYQKTGSTTVKKGGSVEFWALPQHPAVFKGWYEGETLLSTDLHFQMTNVQKSTNVTAKFDEIYTDGFHESHDGYTAWSNPSAMPAEAGKYYLTTDVTIDKFWEAPDGIVLCLNGHVLKNTSTSAAITVNPYCQVIVTDCDTSTKHYFDQNGIGAWVLNDENTSSPYSVTGGVVTGVDRCMYVYGNGVLYMCGGNAVGASGNKNGPGVSTDDGGIFYMYGGTIQGNVNTNTGLNSGDQTGSNDETVQEFDGGGGLFVDVGAYVYIGGDSVIANNTALYTNNGGGVYNYRGTVELDGNIRIENNRGANGAASNYQGYQYRGTPSLMYIYNDLTSDARIGVSMSANCEFSDFNYADYTSNFFADDVNKTIKADGDYILSIGNASVSGYIVTAGTRGAGSATVNGTDGAKGVVVSKGASATLVATTLNDDYIFLGWYNQDGSLITTSSTYTINRVTENKHVQAYFMMKDEPINVAGAGTVHVFNSGDDTTLINNWYESSIYDYRYKNPEFSTFDNGGKYLYFSKVSSENYFDEEGPVGLPFTIDGKVLEKSVVTMNCYDVDEDSGERDVVYLLDLTNHTRVELGYLTGTNNKWTTTSFTVAPELLQEGHTYQLYLVDEVSRWVAWIDTASISIGAMETQEIIVEPITSASISGAISNTRKVTGELNVILPEAGAFDIEFKATYTGTNEQLGYAFYEAQTLTAPEFTLPYTFTLESGAPEGAYRIDAYILDLDGNVVKTVNCTAGYSYVTVTYDANGGSNNLPEDTNSYKNGDKVTVKFDYTPSYPQTFAMSSAPVFTGWSTDPEAVEPEYTEDGANTFNIGAEDVTLYAVYHVHVEGDPVITPPTCTAPGLEQYYCECGELIDEVEIEPTGHTMGEWIIDVDATDDTEGSMHRDCEVCSYRETETIPAKGHTYTSTVVPPNCTEQGYTEHTCTNEGCGDSYITDYVDALGHTEEIVPGYPATCTEPGLTDGVKCSVCDVTIVEQQVIDPHGHNYVIVTEIPASCTEMGSVTSTCTGCGDTKTEDGEAAKGHSYTAVVTPATCGSDGYTDYTCTVCGHAYRGDYVDATGDHVYGEETVTEPTCVDGGYVTKTCSVCGHVHEAAGDPAHEIHTYVVIGEAPSCTEAGVTNHTCEVCGHDYTETKEATGHTPSDWIVDSEPTETEAGQKHKECTVCSEILETVATYKITVKAEANGTASGGGIVDAGASMAITAAPKLNYAFAGWYLGDTLVSESAEYTIENISACATYTAKFEPLDIPYMSGEGGYLYINSGSAKVTKISIVYIGEKELTIKNWDDMVAAAQGEFLHDTSVKDRNRWGQQKTGYYACYIRAEGYKSIYNVLYLDIPYIYADGGDLVIESDGIDITKVSIVFIGEESKTVTDWDHMVEAAQGEFLHDGSVIHADKWPQYQKGYYACYIKAPGYPSIYNVVYMENPYTTPYIFAQGGDLVMHAGGYTIDNVKIAFIGAEPAEVNTWKQFAAAIYPDTSLKCYNNVADATKWPQYTAGYYACYIRTLEIGVVYSVVYMENPYSVPTISVENENLVMNAGGYTIENVKIAYIGAETAEIENWSQFVAAKDPDTALKYYSNVADQTKWPQSKVGYYACYIRTSELGVLYNVVYLENPSQAAPTAPDISIAGGQMVLSANGFEVDKICIGYVGEEAVTVKNWTQFSESVQDYRQANDAEDGMAWDIEQAGYYAVYIRYINAEGVTKGVYLMIDCTAEVV